MSKPEEPKDLGVKIGTPKEAWWKTIKDKVTENILNSEESLKADRAVLEVANNEIEKEKTKMAKPQEQRKV